MKRIVKKFKEMPKFVQVAFAAMTIGAIGAGVMSIFGIDLNTLWRNIYFASVVGGVYLHIYKPFKK